MTPSRRDYLLFVLARMRAKERVESALRDLGSGPSDPLLETPPVDLLDQHPAQLHIDLLGPPGGESVGDDGLVTLRWVLEPWPVMDWEVPVDPSGLARRPRFARRGPPPSPLPLLPWGATEPEVLSALPGLRFDEAWAWWSEYSEPGGSVYLFDWGLLQAVEPP